MRFYTVQTGDSPMKIAAEFTGNPDRYVELVAANPQLPAVMTEGPVGARTFAPYAFQPGVVLKLPESWYGSGSVEGCSSCSACGDRPQPPGPMERILRAEDAPWTNSVPYDESNRWDDKGQVHGCAAYSYQCLECGGVFEREKAYLAPGAADAVRCTTCSGTCAGAPQAAEDAQGTTGQVGCGCGGNPFRKARQQAEQAPAEPSGALLGPSPEPVVPPIAEVVRPTWSDAPSIYRVAGITRSYDHVWRNALSCTWSASGPFFVEPGERDKLLDKLSAMFPGGPYEAVAQSINLQYQLEGKTPTEPKLLVLEAEAVAPHRDTVETLAACVRIGWRPILAWSDEVSGDAETYANLWARMATEAGVIQGGQTKAFAAVLPSRWSGPVQATVAYQASSSEASPALLGPGIEATLATPGKNQLEWLFGHVKDAITPRPMTAAAQKFEGQVDQPADAATVPERAERFTIATKVPEALWPSLHPRFPSSLAKFWATAVAVHVKRKPSPTIPASAYVEVWLPKVWRGPRALVLEYLSENSAGRPTDQFIRRLMHRPTPELAAWVAKVFDENQ